MTHLGPVSDATGKLSGKVPSDQPCPHCGVEGRHYYSVWESHDGAYDDERHECHACGKGWWADGPDS